NGTQRHILCAFVVAAQRPHAERRALPLLLDAVLCRARRRTRAGHARVRPARHPGRARRSVGGRARSRGRRARGADRERPVHCGVLSVGVRKKLGLPSPFDLRFSNPLDLHAVALAYATVPIIIPHFGAGLFREALMVADLCPNVLFDTSSSNAWIRYQAGLTLAGVFRQALAVLGDERLLFGTDSSFFPRGWVMNVFEQQSQALDEIGAGVDVRENVFGGNFDRLFPR